jgi:major intracellular serine protease
MTKEIQHKCKLLPFSRREVLSIQESKQQLGWGITVFDLPEVWKKTQGEGVVVAVLDSGCDLNHPDLKNNLLSGKNFIDPTKEPIDENGHGTHCTGIICAENNLIGMVGVAPKTKVIPVKVLDKNGSGNLIDVANGIRWAVDQKVDFISLSLGSPIPVEQVRTAIQYAESKGVVCFCAAGNAGNTREIFYPANYPETIGIGSINKDFDRSNFSCTGTDLDFLAPGNEIFSTVPESWYAILSGTSMANPFVVGIACLLLSYNRETGNKINLMSCQDYRDELKKHCVDVKNKEFANQKFFEGFGIINPQDLFNWISETPTNTSTPTPSLTGLGLSLGPSLGLSLGLPVNTSTPTPSLTDTPSETATL